MQLQDHRYESVKISETELYNYTGEGRTIYIIVMKKAFDAGLRRESNIKGAKVTDDTSVEEVEKRSEKDRPERGVYATGVRG